MAIGAVRGAAAVHRALLRLPGRSHPGHCARGGEGFGESSEICAIRSSSGSRCGRRRSRRCSRSWLAIPLTGWCRTSASPAGDLIRALVTVPFVLPTVVVGWRSWRSACPPASWGILAAHVFFNVAVVVRTVGGVWSRARSAASSRPPARSVRHRGTAFRTSRCRSSARAIAAAAVDRLPVLRSRPSAWSSSSAD